jgi:UDP-N-acetylglucosamine diphosphorylase/glucosamine-1-phosphate N-acetyltransferase
VARWFALNFPIFTFAIPSVNIILFEDEFASQLAPVAAAEPAFAVTCGAYKLAQLAGELGTVYTSVRKHLASVETETFPQRVLPKQPLVPPVLVVNARLVPSVSAIERLKAIVGAGREGVVKAGESIAAALVTSGPFQFSMENLRTLPTLEVELPLFEYPHDVLRHHLTSCRENLEHRIKAGHREVRDGLFVAENVTLGEHLVIDVKNGPVVIDHDAVIGPFCFLRGPVYIGPKARVNEHAAIKDCVSLGHNTKVGGEVEASIVEPYSNKQHHGFLGHSYVGSWVNLGAGTSNSDLKNTYGTVNMESSGRKISTGMQFVGCFIGDYVKAAINTSIFTGKTIGACSTVYGFVTTNVPSFCNYAKSFGQVTDLPAEVMIEIQRRSFARRHVTQRECDIRLIRDLYELARRERHLPDDPLAF